MSTQQHSPSVNLAALPAEHPATDTAERTRKWWVLLAVGVGSAMASLDSSIVNTVLPILSQAFATDVATIEWVVTTYLLVVSSLLLTFGRLGDLRGHKAVYVSGFGVFVLGSMLCGLAPSAPALIGARIVQALGAATLFANAPAILTTTFPPRQRGQALGLQGMMIYTGLTIGPSLGGWIAEHLHWRLVFYINVPVGLLAVWLSLRFIPSRRPSSGGERFDLLGALIFMVALIALLLGLNQGHAWGWSSPAVLGLLGAAALLLALFVRLELRTPAPMLDLRLFRNRVFSGCVASAVLNYLTIYSLLFLLPFYLLRGRGLSPSQAGLLLTAQPLVMAVTAPLSGTLSDRLGTRLPATLGMAILALGALLLSQLGPASPPSEIVLGLALAGLGTGAFTSPNSSALLGAAPANRQGIASGILATARNVGMALGIGVAGAVFTTLLGGADPTSASPALFQAVRGGLLVAAGAAALGAITSAVRPSPSVQAPPPPLEKQR